MTTEAGAPIELDSSIVRTTVSGVSTVRVKLRSFELPAPASVIVQTSGIGDRTEPTNRLVFARPITGPMVGHILGIILLAFITIGSLVGAGLALARR